MSNWPLFLTAHDVAPKALNKAFLMLQDLEFTEPFTDSRWVLLTSSDPTKISPKPVTPPLEPPTSNFFTNKTPTDINNFIRAEEAGLQKLGLVTGQWVIIDQEGLDHGTCIVADQIYDGENETMTSTYQALRLPFEEAWGIVCNLEIANMGFEEWVDEDAGVQSDGLYRWVGEFPITTEAGQVSQKSLKEKREEFLKTWRDLGHID